MLHRDVDRFDVREGKWIKWYESHLCMYIKSRGELGRKFGIEFVKGMKVCRQKKKKEFFFLVFDYQSFDANEWPGKSVFPPDENPDHGFALLRSSLFLRV